MFKEFVIIFALSIAVIYFCHKIKLPAIVGFLITGVLAGPYGLGFVKAVHEVETIAEVGVVLLMFTIGMELSLGELARLKRQVFLGGGAQVLLTILVFDALAMLMGYERARPPFGFLAALSSTAIGLRLLQQRAEMDSPHGRVSLSILILQDLIIVPMMLLVPFLSERGSALSTSLLLTGLQGAGLILLVFFLARKFTPRILRSIVGTRSRELFLLSTLSLCLTIAWFTSSLGLSLSLGAFMAGLIMSESEYSLSALEGILPFRDVFTSVFFISVGMLLDVQYVVANVALVGGATVLVLLIKALLAGGAAFILGFPLKPAVMVGLALCQVGEFSFVLAKAGVSHGLMNQEAYQLFLAASILTMAATPPLIALSPRVAQRLASLPVFARMKPRPPEQEMEQACSGHACASDHLIIVGYGIGGRHLAQAAKRFGISYRIIEMNPETVRKSRGRGRSPSCSATQAKAPCLSTWAWPRPRAGHHGQRSPSTRRITDAGAQNEPGSAHRHAHALPGGNRPALELGASDVIPEEFETSVEIFKPRDDALPVPRAESNASPRPCARRATRCCARRTPRARASRP